MKGSDAVNVTYRKALPSDLSLLTDIEKKCFNEQDRFKKYQMSRFLNDPMRSVISDVILADGEPVGWACFFTRANSALIRLYGMCVLPEFAGKGYATAYLEKRIGTFKKYRTLALEVRASNKKAIGLYAKLGFQKDKELPGYYPDGEHALRMILEMR